MSTPPACSARLPAAPDPRSFDALHDEPAAWQPALQALAQALGEPGLVQPLTEGTVLVARLGQDKVLKLFPPFLRDHWAFERGMLQRLHGRLAVPTPELLGSGEEQGWPWLLMGHLEGDLLLHRWPQLPEAQRLGLLRQIGELAAQVHAQAVGSQAQLAPRWDDFIARQRAQCRQRQEGTGLPTQLLAGLESFIAGPVTESGDSPDVLLTGEFTPMNLFVDAAGHKLVGLFDFGDGLIGPAAYDFGGPLCFLAAGNGPRAKAFFAGYGVPPPHPEMQLRLLLLHRYSNLKAQVASCTGWDRAESLPALARLLWP